MGNDAIFDFVVYDDTNRQVKIRTEEANELGIVSRILEKFDEFDFLRPIKDNGFLIIRNTKKKSKPEILETGEAKPVIISKISEKTSQIYEQLCGKKYHFQIEFVWQDLESLDLNQIAALTYFELRKIRKDFKLGDMRKNDWLKILHGLGKGFNRIDTSCPAILDPDFSWKTLLGEYYAVLDASEEQC